MASSVPAPGAGGSAKPMPYGLLTIMGMAVLVAITTEVLPVGLLPVIGADLGASDSRTGLLVSAYALIVAVFSVPLTAVVTRWPRRRVLCGLLVIYAVSNAIMAVAGTYWIAMTARVLGGLAHAGFFSAVYAAAIAVAPSNRPGRAVAYVSGGVALGLAAGVPLGTAIGTAAGWRWAFAGCAVVMAVLAVVIVRAMPASPPPATDVASPSVLAAVRSRAVLLVATMIVIVTLGHYTTYTYVSPLLLHDGVPMTNISVILAGYGAACVLGLVIAGWVADRSPRRALQIGIAVTGTCLLALGLAHHAVAATVVVVAWGMAFGALPTLIQAVALRTMPDSPDAAPAVVNATFNVGIAGGALLGARELLVAAPPVLALTGAGLALASLPVLAGLPRAASAVSAGQSRRQEQPSRPITKVR